MSRINVQFNGLDDFLAKLERAGRGSLKEDIQLWLEAIGIDFLDLIQDEIIRVGAVDTRLLLNSFSKQGEGNVWEISNDGLTLEVGTNVKYAKYVNDGHWLNPNGVSTRFVPGRWSGERFIYDPGANTGMMLKQKWIEGYHFWESAKHIYERMFSRSLERKLQRWFQTYFS